MHLYYAKFVSTNKSRAWFVRTNPIEVPGEKRRKKGLFATGGPVRAGGTKEANGILTMWIALISYAITLIQESMDFSCLIFSVRTYSLGQFYWMKKVIQKYRVPNYDWVHVSEGGGENLRFAKIIQITAINNRYSKVFCHKKFCLMINDYPKLNKIHPCFGTKEIDCYLSDERLKINGQLDSSDDCQNVSKFHCLLLFGGHFF